MNKNIVATVSGKFYFLRLLHIVAIKVEKV